MSTGWVRSGLSLTSRRCDCDLRHARTGAVPTLRRCPAPVPRVLAAPLVAAVVVLALGAAVAVGVGQALGLSFEPADTPPR